MIKWRYCVFKTWESLREANGRIVVGGDVGSQRGLLRCELVEHVCIFWECCTREGFLRSGKE